MSQRRRGQTGGSSSSNDGRKMLPLIECPRCHSSVIRLVSKQPDTYGWVFYKCEQNMQDDPTTCRFWKWENDYELYLRRHNRLPVQQGGEVDRFPCEIEPGLEVNQAQDDARIWRTLDELKSQIAELSRNIDFARNQFAVAIVVAASVGFFLGLVMVLLLKHY